MTQDMTNALAMIRQRIPLEEVQLTTSQIYNEHSCLADCDPLNLTDRITDLLEEYGDDHDLPEGWYLNEVDDIEDVLQMY